MRNRQQQEVNALPMRFAFSQEQFHEVMKEWGLDQKKIWTRSPVFPLEASFRKRMLP